MDKNSALKSLQLIKCFLQNVATETSTSPNVIADHLNLIDQVQKFIEPNVDFDKLQDELNKKK